jgi:hypothetical protein
MRKSTPDKPVNHEKQLVWPGILEGLEDVPGNRRIAVHVSTHLLRLCRRPQRMRLICHSVGPRVRRVGQRDSYDRGGIHSLAQMGLEGTEDLAPDVTRMIKRRKMEPAVLSPGSTPSENFWHSVIGHDNTVEYLSVTPCYAFLPPSNDGISSGNTLTAIGADVSTPHIGSAMYSHHHQDRMYIAQDTTHSNFPYMMSPSAQPVIDGTHPSARH